MTLRDRFAFFVSALGIMTAGLVWRLVPMGLPVFWLRHGGAVLWGAMVFCLVAALRPARFGVAACLVAATTIAIAAELFRLIHAPALETFRDTLAGALLLGRVFSVWNMVAYEVGIAAAAIASRRSLEKAGRVA